MDSYKKGGQSGNSNLLATNRLFKKNPLFKKKKKKASGIYNPNAAFKYEEGGALLTKKVTCKDCGWKWDAADGGTDVTTCHKCGGLGLVHAQDGGDISIPTLNTMNKGGALPCPKGYIFHPAYNSCIPEELYRKSKYGTSQKDIENDLLENEKYKEAYDYMKDYYNSPKYKEMLKRSSANNEAYNFTLNARNKQLESTPPLQILPQPKDQPNTGGYSESDTGQIVMLPKGFGTEGTSSHELSHSSDRPWARQNRRLIPQKDIDYINKNKAKSLKDSREYFNYKWYYDNPSSVDFRKEDADFKNFYTDYVGEPTEVRARLNAIRQAAKKNNLYDPFTEGVTPDTYYKKLKNYKFEKGEQEGFDPMKQLQNTFSDEEIIWMLNNISKNNSKEENNFNEQVTKFGGAKMAKGGSTKDYIEVDIPEEQIQDYIDQGYIIEPVGKPKMEEGGTPSQLWYQYTGTPWSEAKAKGLTDGSAEQNLALAQRLKSGEFGEPNLNIQQYENRRASYDDAVINMVRQGQTLDQLVESRIGTREGLLQRFPDLFSGSSVPTRTQVVPTAKAKTKTPEQTVIEQKIGKDWLMDKAKELGNEVIENTSNSFWGKTAKKVGQATYNYMIEQQTKDREAKKKQEQVKLKKVEKEVQKEIKKISPKVVKTPSVLDLLQQASLNYQEKPLKKFTDTKSESDFATNLMTQVKQNQKRFGLSQPQQPIVNGMGSNFAQGQNPMQMEARNKAMGITPQNLPVAPSPSIGWKKWEDTDLGYAYEGLSNSVDATIQQGKRYLEKKGILNVPDETVKIKKPKTIVKETPKPKEFIEQIATVKDNMGNPTDSLMSYRNQWDNSKGFKYLATPVKQDRTGDEEYKNVMGVGHFLLDASATESKPFSHAYNKKYLENAKKNNDWIPTFTDEGNDYVRLKYKKPNEITKEDKIVTPLRQMTFGDIRFDKTQHAKGFANAKEVTKKDGKGTYLIFKDRDGYSRFSGGSVVFIFKDKYNNTIVRDFAGSLNQIENEGLNIQKTYNIKPDELTIGYHDVGSFSAKPKASSNGTLKSKQWEGFNNEGMTGGALLIPKQK